MESYYKGQWINNEKGKYGNYYFKNGDFYEGEFESNNFHGFGSLYKKQENKIEEGIWIKGALQQQRKKGDKNCLIY